MSEFSLSPEAVVVLFDHFDSDGVLTCLADLPEVSPMRYEMYSAEFARRGLLRGSSENDDLLVHPTLLQIVQPILTPQRLMILETGVAKELSFNASVHFSDSGMTAIINQGSFVRFVGFSTPEQLLSLLPDIRSLLTDQLHLSYIISEGESRILHAAVYSASTCRWHIEDTLVQPDQRPEKLTSDVSTEQYAAALQAKWEGLCHVSRS